MANETVKYRVELDTSDLASQLESIRSQIDNVMSQVTNSPSLNVGNINFADAMSRFQAMPPPPDGSFISPGFSQYTSPDVVAAVSQKFQSDFSTFIPKIDFSAIPSAVQQVPSSDPYTPQTFWESAKGAVGFGYEQSSAYSRGEYYEGSKKYFTDTVLDNVGEGARNLWSITNTAANIGSFIPPLTPFAAPIALAMDTVDIFTSQFDHYRERDQVAAGIQAMGKRLFGNITKNESIDIANEFSNKVYSYNGRLEDYSMNEVEGAVLSFANAGGFSGTRNAEQLKDKVRDVMDNFRDVMKTLHMSSEEAMELMGQLSSRGITSPSQMGGFSADMKFLGGLTGMSGDSMISFGMNTGGAIASGTGLTLQEGFNSSTQAYLETVRLMRSGDPYMQREIVESGGITSFASRMAQETMGQVFNNPMYGYMAAANIASPGQGFGSMTDMISGAAQIYGDPEQYLKFLGTKKYEMESQGFGSFYGSVGATVLEAGRELQAMNMGTTPENLMGWLQMKGFSPEVARANVDTVVYNKQHTDSNFEDMEAYNRLQTSINNGEVTKWDVVSAKVGTWFSNLSNIPGNIIGEDDTFGERIYNGMSNTFEEYVRRPLNYIEDFFNNRTTTRFSQPLTQQGIDSFIKDLKAGVDPLKENKLYKAYGDVTAGYHDILLRADKSFDVAIDSAVKELGIGSAEDIKDLKHDLHASGNDLNKILTLTNLSSTGRQIAKYLNENSDKVIIKDLDDGNQITGGRGESLDVWNTVEEKRNKAGHQLEGMNLGELKKQVISGELAEQMKEYMDSPAFKTLKRSVYDHTPEGSDHDKNAEATVQKILVSKFSSELTAGMKEKIESDIIVENDAIDAATKNFVDYVGAGHTKPEEFLRAMSIVDLSNSKNKGVATLYKQYKGEIEAYKFSSEGVAQRHLNYTAAILRQLQVGLDVSKRVEVGVA